MKDDNDKDDALHAPDREAILIALDQISQTIDVMNSVVGRLRGYVEDQAVSQDAEARAAVRPGRILH